MDLIDHEKNCKFKKETFNRFLSCMYLENANKLKYSLYFSGLSTQQSLGNDQYPKTITETNNVLSNSAKLINKTTKKFKQSLEAKKIKRGLTYSFSNGWKMLLLWESRT